MMLVSNIVQFYLFQHHCFWDWIISFKPVIWKQVFLHVTFSPHSQSHLVLSYVNLTQWNECLLHKNIQLLWNNYISILTISHFTFQNKIYQWKRLTVIVEIWPKNLILFCFIFLLISCHHFIYWFICWQASMCRSVWI